MSNIKKYYKQDLKKLIKFLTLGNPESEDFIVMNNIIGKIKDIQTYFSILKRKVSSNNRIVIIYYNHLWEPLLNFMSFLGLRKHTGKQNWLDEYDIKNLLELSGFEIITSQRRMLLPIDIPFVSNPVNKYLAFLPFVNLFCLTTYVVAKLKKEFRKDYSVSIIIPAKNEEGNIGNIIKKIPKFGLKQEIIFIEGNSKDNTWGKILEETRKKHKSYVSVQAIKQRGKGKANAVRLGFKEATGDILIIYDADRTVEEKDLKKFYDVLASGKGEFINGSRLIYPMEKDAMRTLNIIGNKFFSLMFTWILGQRFKDTLCGTKAFFKKDYVKFKRFKDDPFGDFELIFGAIRNNLKIIEVPVRYKERVYGSTNINRFKHGLLLFKITWIAFKTFKAW